MFETIPTAYMWKRADGWHCVQIFKHWLAVYESKSKYKDLLNYMVYYFIKKCLNSHPQTIFVSSYYTRL